MEPVSAPALDVAAIANQFPILKREIGGRPLTYLDSAATAQTPEPAHAEVGRLYRESNAKIHRGDARARAQRDGPHLPRVESEHPPRRLPAVAGVDRGVRGRAPHDRRLA